MIPSREQCLVACRSRDQRFDGWFIVGVTSTGIYCRPSCPTPVSPKPQHMEFYASAAAAQRRGFRACKRCRPDASPGSPAWNTRADLIGRAMRLIADGVVDRDGVVGLARRLAVSERHLTRMLANEVGAGPLALARAQRAQVARVLIETTSMPFAEVALAAGFRSVRQFNDTVREVFAAAPRDLRRGRTRGVKGAEPALINVRLPFRTPIQLERLLAFLGARTISGVETWDGETYRRTLNLPKGIGIVALRPHSDHVACELHLDSVGDTQVAVQRCRRLLDLDADPVAIADVLERDPSLAPLVRRAPGLRSPGGVDGVEVLTRAIVGQQVSVAGARTVLARLVDAAGGALTEPSGELTHTFPSAAAILEAPDAAFAMPSARRAALRQAVERVVDGGIAIDAGADRDQLRTQLTAIPGIGTWTAEYVAMRGIGDPDAFPSGDLGLRHGFAALGGDPRAASLARASEVWRPWRAYAAHHLWNHLEVGNAQ